jgi:hypothetical protein
MQVQATTLALDALADAARRHKTVPKKLWLPFPVAAGAQSHWLPWR